MIARTCETCAGPFKASAAEVNRGWGRFCSRACRGVAQSDRQRAAVDTRCPKDLIRSRVEGDPNGGCWLWTGRQNSSGYGRVKHGGVEHGAHRLSFTAFVGPIPSGMGVCHRCDVPLCVNPEHLFLGTPKDNTDDMVRKGRNRNQWSAPTPERSGATS